MAFSTAYETLLSQRPVLDKMDILGVFLHGPRPRLVGKCQRDDERERHPDEEELQKRGYHHGDEDADEEPRDGGVDS